MVPRETAYPRARPAIARRTGQLAPRAGRWIRWLPFAPPLPLPPPRRASGLPTINSGFGSKCGSSRPPSVKHKVLVMSSTARKNAPLYPVTKPTQSFGASSIVTSSRHGAVDAAPALRAAVPCESMADLATEPGAFEAVPGEARRALAFALVDCAARDAADAGAYAARFRDAVAARVGRPTDAPPPPCLREGWCVVLARVSRGRSFPVGSRSRRRTSRTAGGGAPWRPRRRTGGGRPAFGNRVGAL